MSVENYCQSNFWLYLLFGMILLMLIFNDRIPNLHLDIGDMKERDARLHKREVICDEGLRTHNIEHHLGSCWGEK